MTEFIRCGRCGTVYDMHGTHGTTVVNGYCPMCGLHHSGTHSIAYPVLKPSPLAAKPIDVPERTCHEVLVDKHWRGCSECAYKWEFMYGIATCECPNYCPNCGAMVVSE